MDRARLHELLRMRAQCLRVPDDIVDRALARCARLGARTQRVSGPITAVTATTTPLPAPSPATVPSLEKGAGAITVPSLGDAATVPSLGPDGAAQPRTAPRGQLQAGRIVAGYRIEGLLGKGGMGSVYRATQLSMDRPVAFKVLAARLADDPTFVGRFKREARAAGRLHHPNLITVHEAGEADGLVYFSMELVEGRSLKDVIKERGRLPPDEVLPIVRQALDALGYAHGRGVVHRDIKPDNIMLTAAGQVKLADLGLSRIDDRQGQESTDLFKTEAGSFMGTPHYMAPEQGRDASTADARADLYALGATLYHLTCGKPPFEGESPMAVLVAAQGDPLVFPEPGPAKPLRDLIRRLMEKDPARRPQDAAAALALAERLLAPAAAQPRPRSRTRRLAIAAAWAISLLLAIGLVAAALRIVSERERDRQWNADIAKADGEADLHRYAEAIDILNRARAAMRDGSPRAAACDAALATITAAWDGWALQRLAGTEQAVRDSLRDRRYADAREALRKVPGAWHSPAAERRLDELQSEWESAVEKDAEAARTVQVPPEQRERRKRALAEWWQRAAIDPPASARIDDGAAFFTATGSGRLPMPPAERPLVGAGIELRLVWKRTAPDARWTLALGPDASVVATPAGAELHQGRKTTPLPVDGEGRTLIRLWRRAAMLSIEVRGAEGQSVPVPLGMAAGDLAMRWQLGAAEVAAHLTPRGR